MESIAKLLYKIDDIVWGTQMTAILLATGVLLSIRFGFRYQRKIGFNFKNTCRKMFSEGEGNGTVSGFKAACTALANTIGTGNISGVATAIVSGGPGALLDVGVRFLRHECKGLRDHHRTAVPGALQKLHG